MVAHGKLSRVHGRFNPATAIEMARELEPFRPSWIEEPVPPENLAALKKVAERVNVPVATGERIHTRYDYRQLFELQAADIIQPDITHFGGLLETRKLEVVDGFFALPHGPGLGVTLDEEVIRQHPRQQIFFNLFAENWHRRQAQRPAAEKQ
ncbi:MAG: enolase C-terminal domain-like protein [Ktedonobacteraceae bacterium]